MAAGAGFGFAVFLELLADRDGAADVGFDCGDVRGWWRDVFTEDAFEHPDAAQHGRGGGAVRGDFQDAALCDEAATRGAGRDGDWLEIEPVQGFPKPVVLCETTVQHREVRVDQVRGGEIVVDQAAKEGAGFAEHGMLQDLIEFGVEVVIRDGEIDFVEVEPLVREILDERGGAGVIEKPVRFGSEGVRIGKPALASELAKTGVGGGSPEEVAEPRGEGMIIEATERLFKEQEAR